MQIFDEIKARGLENVLFIRMDVISGLEEGAKSIFHDVVVQRCIVRLIRNSIQGLQSLQVYGASGLKAAEAEFDRFKQAWNHYLGALDVWKCN